MKAKKLNHEDDKSINSIQIPSSKVYKEQEQEDEYVDTSYRISKPT